MTAPVVVASWISLQYYASTVDNERFGSGNKVLHNVVGRLGVFEGTAGDLRTGLPWQSVHDGVDFQHEPLRLNVVIEAPTAAMDEVLAQHDHVRHLVENNGAPCPGASASPSAPPASTSTSWSHRGVTSCEVQRPEDGR